MTKEKFKEVIKKIAIAYPRHSIATDKETLDVWYKCLEYMDDMHVDETVIRAIQKCEFPPVIADLCKEYNEIEAAYKSKMHEIHMNFDVGSGGFPYGDDYKKTQQEAYQVFLDLTVGLAEDDIDKAVYYSAQLRSKSRRDFDAMESDPDIRKNFPTYTQYLQKLKDGLKHEP